MTNTPEGSSQSADAASPPTLKSYVVRYETEIDAESPEDAAKQVAEWLREPTSMLPILDVAERSVLPNYSDDCRPPWWRFDLEESEEDDEESAT